MKPSLVGRQLGQYLIHRLLGAGGMGSVYEATHQQIGRRVAIKVLHREDAENSRLAERFLQEARAASRIQHPGIALVLDYALTEDGTAYLVMEYVDGETLAQHLRSQVRLEPAAALNIVRQIATVLTALHAQQIIHRDLKPENVMIVTADGRIKLVDFGLAAICEPRQGRLSRLTGTGVFMGTPTYMSPEQCRDFKQTTDRTDVYSLGVLFYELVAGRPPFLASSLGEMMALHLFAKPPCLAEQAPGLPAVLYALVDGMLAKQPEHRPAMAQVTAALASIPEVLCSAGAPPAAPSSAAKRWRPAALLSFALCTSLCFYLHGLWFKAEKSPSSLGPVKDAAPVQAAPNVDSIAALRLPGRRAASPAEGGKAPRIPAEPHFGLKSSPSLLAKDRAPGGANASRRKKAAEHGLAKSPSDPSQRRAAAVVPDQARPADERSPGTGLHREGGASRFVAASSIATSLKPALLDTKRMSILPEFPSSLRRPPGWEAPLPAPALAEDAPANPADRLVEAQQLRRNRQYDPAIGQALRAVPALGAQAWEVLGVLACEAGGRRLGLLRDAYRHVAPVQRACLVDVCAQRGIRRQGTSFRKMPPGKVVSPAETLGLGEASLALEQADYPRAAALARQALPHHFQDAWLLIGRAACGSGDRAMAAQALCRLSPGRRENLIHTCGRVNVSL